MAGISKAEAQRKRAAIRTEVRRDPLASGEQIRQRVVAQLGDGMSAPSLDLVYKVMGEARKQRSAKPSSAPSNGVHNPAEPRIRWLAEGLHSGFISVEQFTRLMGVR